MSRYLHILWALLVASACQSVPEREEPVAPASSALAVSGELELEPGGAVGPALGRPVPSYDDGAVAAAFDGTNYLVAWADDRGFDTEILASRVSTTGTVLDSAPIRVGALTGVEANSYAASRVSVVHSQNGGYLVSWQGNLFPVSVRIKDDGTVVDKEPFTFGFSDERPQALSAGFAALTMGADASGAHRDILLVDGASSAAPQLRRVSGALAMGGDGWFQQRFAADGDRVVAIQAGTTKLGKPIPATYSIVKGDALERSERTLPGWDGANYTGYVPIAAWFANGELVLMKSVQRSDGGAPTVLTRYSVPNMTVLGEAGLAEYQVERPSADDHGFITYQGNPQNQSLCRYTSAFALLGCTPDEWRPQSNYYAKIVPALTPTQFLMPFKVSAPTGQSRRPAFQIYDRATGNPTSGATPTILARSANSQRLPTVAGSSSGRFLAAWVDDAAANKAPEDGGEVALLVRDAAEGSPVVKVTSPGVSAISAVRLLGGRAFSVAWVERRASATRVMFARLSDTTPLTVEESIVLWESTQLSSNSVSLSEDSSGILVVWNAGDYSFDILEKRLPPGATQAAADAARLSVLSSSDIDRNRTNVASVFDGRQSVIVWEEVSNKGTSRIAGTTILDRAEEPTSVAQSFATGFGRTGTPALATNGRGTLLVFADLEGLFGLSGSTPDIYGSLLRTENPIPDDPGKSFKIATGNWLETSPTVAYANDSESYVVAWGDRRNANQADIYGAFVDLKGRVLSAPEGELLSGDVNDEDLPQLATGSVSTVGLVYNRYDRDPKYNALRARFRTINTGKLNGEGCTASLDCASRSCVDGICCDDPCNQGCGTCGGAGPLRGICSPIAKTSVCGVDSRNRCDGQSLACPTSCASDAECVAPSKCLEGRCSGTRNTCSSDGQLVTVDGTQSCGLYACDPVAGACRTLCESVDECAVGFVCNEQHQCVTPPPPSNDGGCSATPQGPRSTMVWLAGATFALVAIRRRTRRTATSSR